MALVSEGVRDSLPCFGALEDHLEEAPPPPPSHEGIASDDDLDTCSMYTDDEAVTVTALSAGTFTRPVAGEVVRDAGEVLEQASSADSIIEEVASAADFLAQFPAGEAASIIEEVASAADFLAQFPAGEAASIINVLDEGSPSQEHAEAAHFVEMLIAHLPDRAAALEALRRGAAPQLDGATSGKVSQFLLKRRSFRTAKIRTLGNWEEHFTRGTDLAPTRRYFYNNSTQRTQWEVPPEFQSLEAIREDDDCEVEQ
eukprot:TRINITY_DN27699_c0_g1_i1.p1 TRINITY_DN27699_c0_g1~~TRINITY_DN27699_c0_g1_i1.p1  ORF type:complete len:276 (+),score=65.97 TRINITY_DN27699_c0_g1_i1:63-830(+)